MALLFVDGFEHYGTGGTSNTNLSSAYTFPAGALSYLCTVEDDQSRTGDYSLRWDGYGWGIRRTLSSTKTKLGAAGWFWVTNAAQLTGLFTFNGAGNAIQIVIGKNTDGSVYAARADDNTVFGTTDPGLLTSQTWVHIAAWVEASSTPSAMDGKVIVRIGGSGGITLTCTGIDTLTGTNTGYTSVNALFANLGEQQYMYLDDFVLNDDSGTVNNAIMEAYRAFLIVPNGDVAGGDFIPESGAGYENINVIPPDDSGSYIQSNAVDDVSDFNVEDPPWSLANVAGIDVHSRMFTSSTGSIRVSVVSSGSIASGTTKTLSASASYFNQPVDLDPDGNTEWTYRSVGRARIRYTRIS
jgi:hypothetical protein